MSELKRRVVEATKTAMKARERARTAALRLVSAEIKRLEVDLRETLSDEQITQVLVRMLKQRRESLVHYDAAGRVDLAARENYEIEVISEFLPPEMPSAEIDALIAEVIEAIGASSIRDMARVMQQVKERTAGRADMRDASVRVKARLTALSEG